MHSEYENAKKQLSIIKRKEWNKEYYKANKEKKKEYQVQYHKKVTKEQRQQYHKNKPMFICECCNKEFNKCHLDRHKTSKKYINNMKRINDISN